MKVFTLLLFLLFANLTSVFSKDCFQGDTLFFYSQSDIDNFGNNYSECPDLDATIIINPINGEITSLQPLETIKSITGSLIVENTNLMRLTGLHNITSVGFGVSIINNNSLIGLTGLNGINQIGQKSYGHIDEVGYLKIESNEKMLNLWGIDNLDSLMGDLIIAENPKLESLQGLESLRTLNGFRFTGEKIETSNIYINNNKNLSTCAVQGICFLRNYAEFDFNNNATHCNSIVEVMGGCSFISVEEENIESFNVYPNPTDGIVNFSSQNHSSNVSLVDNLGRIVYQNDINDLQQLDISNQPSGIYYLRIDNQMIRILKK